MALTHSLVKWFHGLMACGVVGSLLIPRDGITHSAPANSSEEVEEIFLPTPETSEPRFYASIEDDPIDRGGSTELARVFCPKADHG
jgi:hypothetical protein